MASNARCLSRRVTLTMPINKEENTEPGMLTMKIRAEPVLLNGNEDKSS